MASFDETDFESLYFHGLNLEDARNILIEEEEGVFLIRDSSRGGYVICVKENDDVSQYPVYSKDISGETNFYIREEFPFKSLSSLLSFYKLNIFSTTSLKRPVSTERVILRRSTRDVADRIKSEIPSGHSQNFSSGLRRSAPPDMTKPYDSFSPFSDGLNPTYVRVIKPRQARGGYNKDLDLKLNDLIRVIGKGSKPGMATGELNGKTGDFPLVNVEHVKPK